LGSVVAITDHQGDLISQHRYLPFGGTRELPNQPTSGLTDYGYTGQRNLDEDLGLMDYKARFYSPVLNRFIQPDSIVPDPTNPQAWNRYSYVTNNPIVYNDPTGHFFAVAVAGVVLSAPVVGVIIVAAAVAITAMMICNAHAPCHNAAVDGISNVADNIFQMGKRKESKQEQAATEMVANLKLTGEERLWWMPKCEGKGGKFLCYAGILTLVSSVLGPLAYGACQRVEAASWIPCPNSNNRKPKEPISTPDPIPSVSPPTSTPSPNPIPTSIPTAPPFTPTTPQAPQTPAPLNRNPIHIPI